MASSNNNDTIKRANMKYLALDEKQYARHELLMANTASWPENLSVYIKCIGAKVGLCGDLIACALADYIRGDDRLTGVRPVRTSIPCQHETGQVTDPHQTVPDYHPLTRDEIWQLLTLAAATSISLRGKIQVRLYQGITGMTCPRPIEGSVAKRQSAVDVLYDLYVENCSHYPTDAIDVALSALAWFLDA
jgi:hypothetical protein